MDTNDENEPVVSDRVLQKRKATPTDKRPAHTVPLQLYGSPRAMSRS